MSVVLSQWKIFVSLVENVNEENLEKARELIKDREVSNRLIEKGYITLSNAAKYNRTVIVEFLLTNGISPNRKHRISLDTPLHYAALNCNLYMVQMLLNKGADINAQNQHDRTPLFKLFLETESFEKSKWEIIQLLLDQKTNLNIRDNNRKNVLDAAIQKRSLKAVQLFLKYGACVNGMPNLNSYTGPGPLYYAALFNMTLVVTLLTDRGATADTKNKDGLTPLHVAVRNGNPYIVKHLLDCGASIDSLTKEGYTPLHYASKQGNEEITTMLLNNGADVNVKCKYETTPLHIAIENGRDKIVKHLLENGAKLIFKPNAEPLHHAVRLGNEKIVIMLLNKGFDVNMHCYKRTALHVAAELGHNKIVKVLLQNGANIESPNGLEETPLHVAVSNGKEKTVALLLNKGATVNARNLCAAIRKHHHKIVHLLLENEAKIGSVISDWSPIHTATSYKDEKMITLLLKKGADVNAENTNGITPLHIATKQGNENIVKFLLENGANIDCEDDKGCVPLHLAVDEANEKIVAMLLNNGANANATIKKGYNGPERTTALYIAIKNDLDNIVKLLAENGAKINAAINYNNDLPLHFAINKNKLKMFELLLHKGADLHGKNEDGLTLLHIATEKGYGNFVKLLIKNGANVESKAKYDITLYNMKAKKEHGVTPLHIATRKSHVNIVKLLVGNGANIDSKTECDVTPLHVAVQCENYNIVEVLLKYGADTNCRNKEGQTALHLASQKNNEKNVRNLLEYGSNINNMCMTERTPLDYAKNRIYICNALMCHIVKMKIANLYLNKKNLMAYNSEGAADSDLEDECKTEIEHMKSEKIENTNISFHDILTKDTSSLIHYLRNENIVQILRSYDYHSKFPIYASMIKSNFIKMIKRKELLDQVNEIFYSLFYGMEEIPVLPDDYVKNIMLSYLSDDDIKNIMAACDPHHITKNNDS